MNNREAQQAVFEVLEYAKTKVPKDWGPERLSAFLVSTTALAMVLGGQTVKDGQDVLEQRYDYFCDLADQAKEYRKCGE